jgi:hypothetical protein
MGVRSTTVLAPLAALLLAGMLTTSCALGGDPEADPERLELERAADALSVSLLRPGAERAFARAGHTLDGGLACTNEAPPAPSGSPGDTGPADGGASPSPGRGGLAVYCTGLTTEGEEVAFEGRLARADLAAREAGDDGLPGDFTGSVDGERIFALDCFQCAPEAGAPEEAADGGDGGDGADNGGEEAGAATPEDAE